MNITCCRRHAGKRTTKFSQLHVLVDVKARTVDGKFDKFGYPGTWVPGTCRSTILFLFLFLESLVRVLNLVTNKIKNKKIRTRTSNNPDTVLNFRDTVPH